MSWPSGTVWLWVGVGLFAIFTITIAAMVAADMEADRWDVPEPGSIGPSDVVVILAVGAGVISAWPITFSLAAAVLFCWGAWAGTVATFRLAIRRGATRKEKKIASPKATSTEPHIAPQGPDDPFCTCPGCGLLGNHDVVVFDGPRENLGPWIEGKSDPYAQRTCWSCGHSWQTRADKEISR